MAKQLYFATASLVVGVHAECTKSVPPGFEFLGSGYDALKGNPLATGGVADAGWKSPIFQFSTTEGKITTDGKWCVPDHANAQHETSCALEESQTYVNSFFKYQNNIRTSFDLDLSLPKYGGFSFNADSHRITGDTQNKTSIFSQSVMTCTVYKLSYSSFSHPPFSDDFLDAITAMPEQFDATDWTFWDRFMSEFGTHIGHSLQLGGRWGTENQFDSSSYQNLIDDGYDVSASINVMNKFKAGITHNESTKITNSFLRAITNNRTYNIGGDYSPDRDTWEKSVADSPMPLLIGTRPIHSFVTSFDFPNATGDIKKKQAALQAAVEAYCVHLDPTKKLCVPPQDIPMPSPAPVAADSVSCLIIENQGAYRLDAKVWADAPGDHSVYQSFNNGGRLYASGQQLTAKIGEYLKCQGHAVAGNTVQCAGNGHPYNIRSPNCAHYICYGSTIGIHCDDMGVSPPSDTHTGVSAAVDTEIVV